MKGLWIILVASTLVEHCRAASVSADDIKNKARHYINSEAWLYPPNKCHLFVGDVLKEVHADAPNRHPWLYSPINASEWADDSSALLSEDPCWTLCDGDKHAGDVIAQDDHVGIVTGNEKTTSALASANPAGLIVENDWGFQSGQDPTCWRFEYSSTHCEY